MTSVGHILARGPAQTDALAKFQPETCRTVAGCAGVLNLQRVVLNACCVQLSFAIASFLMYMDD